jgi:hypothetical protein
MRKLKILPVLALVLPMLASVLAPSGAAAAPTVKVRGKAVPIPGWPGTGNKYGAGAAVEVEMHISGTEYGGFPPPLIGVNAYLPTGVHLHPQGFKTCPTATIFELKEPEACPKGSAAGPKGEVKGVVAFGGTRVHENAELFTFFAPNGGLEFFTFGHIPTTLEIPSAGKYTNLNGGGGFGPIFKASVPLVETVPGAPYASAEFIKVKIGAAYRDKKTKKVVYYGRVPLKCPKGGFRVKGELTFAENGNIATPVTVVVPFRAPCPAGKPPKKH